MKNNLFHTEVTALMREHLITLHPKEKLERAKQIFHDYDFHHIPIVADGKLVGIISQGDILNIEGIYARTYYNETRKLYLGTETVDIIMKRHVITVEKDATIMDAIDQMLDYYINAVPVVHSNEIIGLITTYDILKWLKLNFYHDNFQLK